LTLVCRDLHLHLHLYLQMEGYPVEQRAEKIKTQQRQLAVRVLRSNTQGMPRMDAVEYLISALEACRALDPTGQKHQLRHYCGGSTRRTDESKPSAPGAKERAPLE
jgi:hypothetical protein